MSVAAPLPRRLVIISRNSLTAALDEDQSMEIFRALAGLSRRGHRIILTAPAPDRWVPTRKTVDGALESQRDLTQKARMEGADIEGVYYVPRSLLTQDRNREGALKDILARYRVSADRVTLISGSAPFLKAASRLSIETVDVSEDVASTLKRVLISLA